MCSISLFNEKQSDRNWEWVLWGALDATSRMRNNTRMRPTHGRSRLCGCVCMMLCFHPLQCLFLCSTNQRLDEFVDFGGLSVMTSSVCSVRRRLSGVLCCIFVMLGLSRRRVEQATLYDLWFAISLEPTCEAATPHLWNLSVDRQGRKSQPVAENSCLRLFGVPQMRDILFTSGRCTWEIVRSRFFLERAGSDSCHVRAVLRVTV